jgi:UDP-hydrolysing UDP-N-acetyl-D-glucosamine 2-epimerase
MKRKICVITGTRADYGLFYPILKKIEASDKLELQLVVSTMHLSSEFGLTYKMIEDDGFKIDEKIENLLSSDTKSAIAKSTGLATILLSDAFARLQPDLVLVLGDRYETLANATTAMLMNIPIAHIHGGEITEGAVDEQIRHAITKMSYLHFTSTEEYRNRVIQMGESSDRVFNTGAPGIDNIVSMNLLSKDDLEKDLDWSFGDKTALFTYHPETLSENNVLLDIQNILSTIEKMELNVLFTYANADDCGRVINQEIEKLCQKNPTKLKVVKSLGQLRYLSAMKHVDVLIGNTSSGILEAASFKKPVVNIGDRQKGRLQSGNVFDCDIDILEDTIKKAMSQDLQNIENIYGVGKASQQIVNLLETKSFSVVKKFIDMDYK